MPKVGKLKLQANGTSYVFQLYYSDDRGFYAKDFPDHISHYMQNHYGNDPQKPVNKAETKDELSGQLKTVLEEYITLTAERKKVIRLRVGVSTQLYLKQKDNEWGIGLLFG